MLKQTFFGLTGLLLVGGLAYAEATFSSSSPPAEDAARPPSVELTSPEQLWALASGVHPGIRVGTSYTIKSDLDEGLWYVGATVYHVPQGEMEVATWLVTGSKSNPGLVLSVDSAAQALSLWPSAQDRFPVSEADPEVWTLLTTLKE